MKYQGTNQILESVMLIGDLIVRQYQEQDQRSVIELWNACSLVVPQNDPVRDIERKLKVNPEMFLVGVINQSIVASVMGGYDGHRGWINYLAVLPSAQRHGIGRRMMAEVEELLRNRDCPKINLQVRSSNAEVVAFYEALGFAVDPVVSLGKRLTVDK
jgi:ribosomal protein S18 acetylase RimI-like enzyme